MLDDARHVYAHSITGQITDTINDGKVTSRSTRHSLTFRTTLDCDGVSMLPCRKSSTFNLPFRADVFDVLICIAVFHHMSVCDRCIVIIQELKCIVKNGGQIHAQAWNKEQKLSKSN